MVSILDRKGPVEILLLGDERVHRARSKYLGYIVDCTLMIPRGHACGIFSIGTYLSYVLR